jgi:MFS transporter, DHA3 family, macrolide efflux protein
MTQHIANNMRVFLLIWFGQLISIIGSSLTDFALGIWVYQRTGNVTLFALIMLSTTLPSIIISPFAGAIVDRWNRQFTMIISDSIAGLSTMVIALLLASNHLAIWHIYLITILRATSNAFHRPAYTSTTTLLVPKQHLSRASGMTLFGPAAAQLISPILGGILLATIQLQGIIVLDFITFAIALITLLSVRLPKIKTTVTEKTQKHSLLKDIAHGLSYITKRPGLLGLLIFAAASNFILGIINVLITPLILSFASATILGTILSIGGIGMLVGTLVVSTYGGPKRRINSAVGFMFLSGLCISVGGLRPSATLLSVTSFLLFFGLPIVTCSIEVIFQNKVPPNIQGRVFALKGASNGTSLTLAYAIAGPLADKVFEPLMTANSPLTASIGQIIGTGTGRGIGLLFIVLGIITMLATIAAYNHPRLRLVESELPDVF